ncbi:MAG: GDSL-type esterase/lipase family protein [Actinomycetota bacterium]
MRPAPGSTVLVAALVLLASACSGGAPTAQPPGASPDPGFSNQARIVFLGDSITVGGVKPGGYVGIVERTLQFQYPELKIDAFGTGVVGNRLPHLIARFDRDVLPMDPTHVVVYVGVNDVGSPPPPGGNTGLRAYREGMVDLVRRIEAAGARAILCTPGVIGETPTSETRENRLLDEYAGAVREVAAATGSRVCDLRAAFTGFLERFNPRGLQKGILTSDGIHLNRSGDRFVARQILNTLNDALSAEGLRT